MNINPTMNRTLSAPEVNGYYGQNEQISASTSLKSVQITSTEKICSH